MVRNIHHSKHHHSHYNREVPRNIRPIWHTTSVSEWQWNSIHIRRVSRAHENKHKRSKTNWKRLSAIAPKLERKWIKFCFRIDARRTLRLGNRRPCWCSIDKYDRDWCRNQKNHIDSPKETNIPVRQFRVNERVSVRDYSIGEKYRFGTVAEMMGKLHYMVIFFLSCLFFTVAHPTGAVKYLIFFLL